MGATSPRRRGAWRSQGTWGGQLPVDLSAVHDLRFVGSDGRTTFAATFDTANPGTDLARSPLSSPWRVVRRGGQGGLVRLVVLAVLVAGCERSSEPSADPPGRTTSTTTAEAAPARLQVQEYPVPAGSRPHDVAPAADGRSVWYTPRVGHLGLLDPATGESRADPLEDGSAPQA